MTPTHLCLRMHTYLCLYTWACVYMCVFTFCVRECIFAQEFFFTFCIFMRCISVGVHFYLPIWVRFWVVVCGTEHRFNDFILDGKDIDFALTLVFVLLSPHCFSSCSLALLTQQSRIIWTERFFFIRMRRSLCNGVCAEYDAPSGTAYYLRQG